MPLTGYSNTISVTTLALLDAYPNAAAAYSVRKLRSAYTGSAIRVRRSSDNTEQDIGFNASGGLDTSALTSFCGSGNGFVTTWYDQSGNARNATETTAVSQPQIVSSGSVININSKPAIQLDATNDRLTVPTSTSYFKFLHDGTKWFSSSVTRINRNTESAIFGNNGSTTAQIGCYMYLQNGTNKLQTGVTNGNGIVATQPAIVTTTTNYTINTQNLILVEADVTNSTLNNRLNIYINNSSINQGNTSNGSVSTNNATQNLQLGAYGNNVWNMDGYYQELIFWASDQSSNRIGIQSNINSYYGIY